MTEEYYFFNSTATDRRRHQAKDIAEYWRSFLSTGLINWDGEPLLEVTADGTNRNVSLSIGRAVMKGHLYRNKAIKDLPIDGPDPTLDRIDRLVLRYDDTIENRHIKSFIIKGEPSDNPVPPELERTYLEGEPLIYEISLAQIRVVAGKSFIEQSDLLDERFNESVCGLASSLISVPTDVFNAQFTAYMQQIANEWQTWFDDVYDDSFITNEQFSTEQTRVNTMHNTEKSRVNVEFRNRDKQLANLNAIADINNRAIGSTGTFYDFFDGTNDFSIAEMDKTSAKTVSDLSGTGVVLSVTNTSGFKIGQEITIVGIKTDTQQNPDVYRRTITNISSGSITINTRLNAILKSGALVARSIYNGNKWSDRVILDSWNNLVDAGNASPSTVTGGYFTFTDDGIYMLPTNSNTIYKLDTADNMYKSHITHDSSFGDAFITRDGRRIIQMSNTISVYDIDHSGQSVSLFSNFTLSASPSGDSAIHTQYFTFEGANYIVTANGRIPRTLKFFKENVELGQFVEFKSFTMTVGTVVSGIIAEGGKVFVLNGNIIRIYVIEGDDVIMEQSVSAGSPSSTSLTTVSEDLKYIVLNNKLLYEENGEYHPMTTGGGITRPPLLPHYQIFSNDGIFLISPTTGGIYFINKNHQLSAILSGIDGTNNATFVPNQDNILYRASGSMIKWLAGRKSYQINSIDIRYNFKSPVANLAVWLQTIGSANFNFYTSMVSAGANESFSTLVKTSKQIEDYYEYEGLRTNRTAPADKVTLKLQFTGLPNIKKLLGAIE